MIIGVITLITVLFFGGPVNFFPIQDVDTGIKKYVADKDRKKELLAEIKGYKKSAKEMTKVQNGYIKELKSLYADRNARRENFEEYKKKLLAGANQIQEKTIEARMQIIDRIQPEEWVQILDLSESRVQKAKDKQLKKGEKNPFAKFEATISKEVADPAKRKKVLEALDMYKTHFQTLTEKIASRNVIDLPTLKNKSASKAELQTLAKEVNTIRSSVFDAVVDFHFEMKENTSEAEFDKLVKAFNKTW